MITKMLATAVILGSLATGGAPASADPNQNDPNPFRSLTCNCQQTTPAGAPAQSQELDRGIQAGLSR
jgi:hypothetical protein